MITNVVNALHFLFDPGVAPPSFLFIKAGTTLYELTTTTGYISLQSVIVLAFLALLSLVPVVFRRRLRKKLD